MHGSTAVWQFPVQQFKCQDHSPGVRGTDHSRPASVGLWIAQAVTPGVAPGTSGLSLSLPCPVQKTPAGPLPFVCDVDLRCYSTSQSVPVTLTPAPDSVHVRPLNAFTVVPFTYLI